MINVERIVKIVGRNDDELKFDIRVRVDDDTNEESVLIEDSVGRQISVKDEDLTEFVNAMFIALYANPPKDLSVDYG